MPTDEEIIEMMADAKMLYKQVKAAPEREGKGEILDELRSNFYRLRVCLDDNESEISTIESESELSEGDPVTARAWLATYAAGGQPMPRRGVGQPGTETQKVRGRGPQSPGPDWGPARGPARPRGRRPQRRRPEGASQETLRKKLAA